MNRSFGAPATLVGVNLNDGELHYFECRIDDREKSVRVIVDGDESNALRIVCPTLPEQGGISLIARNTVIDYQEIAIFNSKMTSKPESNRPAQKPESGDGMESDLGNCVRWDWIPSITNRTHTIASRRGDAEVPCNSFPCWLPSRRRRRR